MFFKGFIFKANTVYVGCSLSQRQSDRNANNSRQRQTAAIVVHECCQRLYYSDFYYKCHITLFYFGYSATWPKGVQRMADQYLKNPVRVFVGSLDLNVSTHKICSVLTCPEGNGILSFKNLSQETLRFKGNKNNYLLPGLSLRFRAAR